MFSTLSANDRLAAIAAVAAILGGFVAANAYIRYSASWLAVLAGLGMLAIVFLPQLSPSTRLPASAGRLMLLVGGIAGVVMLLLLVTSIGFVTTEFNFNDVLFLVAVGGSLVMGWAGWAAYSAERVGGGKDAPPSPPPAPPAA